ncbi:protein piccolo [Phascolarctos cinereus]
MGNEASLEGEGLPEGLTAAAAAAAAAAGEGDGGAGSTLHTMIPAGMEADLSQLSEEERRQIAAVMSRAQGLPKGNVPPAAAEPPSMQRKPEFDTSHHPKQPGKPPDPGRPGQPTLSKSRTTDTLRTEQKSPGRSPSTTSLRESKSRMDFKEEQKSSIMPSFLTDSNPLSAVSSVVNKFNPFDLISDSDVSQEEATRKQKAAQKEQGKPEGITKSASQQQSPKRITKLQGPPKATSQQAGTTKSIPPQQPGKTKPQSLGTGKTTQALGPAEEEASQSEQAKPQLQQRGPTKSQPDPAKSDPAKSVPQGPSKILSQQPGPTKLPSQQPDPAKPPVQQSGPTKPLTQQPGPTKPPTQQPGPSKPPTQQPGPSKPPTQQPGPTKLPTPQTGASKTLTQQPGTTKPSTQQPGPSKTPTQQPGTMKPPAQQLGPTKPPPQQPGPTKPLGQQTTKPSSQQAEPGKPLQPQSTSSPSTALTSAQVPPKTFCPLCTTTELLLHTPEKANYNTCTQCQTTVCSLCGFSPPHITEVKEWLCLNCQMQRALGGDLAPVPSTPQQKQKVSPVVTASSVTKPAPPSHQTSLKKDVTPKPDLSKPPEIKKPPLLTKQPSIPGSPPAKAKQPSPRESVTQPTPHPEPSLKSEQAKAPMADDKPKQPKIQKPTADVVASSLAAAKPDLPGSKIQSQVQEKTAQPPKTDSAKSTQIIPPGGDKEVPPDSKGPSRTPSDSKLISQPGVISESKSQKQVDPIQKKEDPKKAQTKMSPKPEPSKCQKDLLLSQAQSLVLDNPHLYPSSPQRLKSIQEGSVLIWEVSQMPPNHSPQLPKRR